MTETPRALADGELLELRRFVLVRTIDVTGVSGPGIVAQGVEFSDGTAVIRWASDRPCTSTWGSVEDVRRIHGHGGATVLRWLDPRRLTTPTLATDTDPDIRPDKGAAGSP